MRALGVVWLWVALAGCGGDARDCACTVTIAEFTKTLGCGEQACIAGSRFGCDEDNVISLGLCSAPDLAEPGACLPLQDGCDPVASTCCAGDADAGRAISPTCDAVSRRCCVATGASCTVSADCCAGRPCIGTAPELRCGS